MRKYIQYFPKPFLDDIVMGRCIPFIGAGFSRNAKLPPGKNMPLWEDLGRELAAAIPDYAYSNPVDAISAYEHEFGKPKLVEQLHQSLMVDVSQPGVAHNAFCAMQFDLVVTTNIEFLLEHAYENASMYCRPIMNEDQLSVDSGGPEVKLLKLHGDLHHPNRLTVTEEDYDRFLHSYPLLSTYLASLLIVRTALFIGYSLDDPDFRHIWQVIGDRLGNLRRLAYAIVVSAPSHVVARYERRGVKVINLPGNPANYPRILESVLHEIGQYWSDALIEASTSAEDESMAELSLPKEATGRLCFFSVPSRLAAFYKTQVFPLAEKHGFAPVMSMDVISPGDNITAKLVALFDHAELIVIDVAIPKTYLEYQMALARRTHDSRLIVIGKDEISLLSDIADIHYVSRPESYGREVTPFLERLDALFDSFAEDLRPKLAKEPIRLLNKREYRAAVISAVALIETEMRRLFKRGNVERRTRALSLISMVRDSALADLLTPAEIQQLTSWIHTRHQIIHLGETVSARTAREIVEGVMGIVQRIDSRPI